MNTSLKIIFLKREYIRNNSQIDEYFMSYLSTFLGWYDWTFCDCYLVFDDEIEYHLYHSCNKDVPHNLVKIDSKQNNIDSEYIKEIVLDLKPDQIKRIKTRCEKSIGKIEHCDANQAACGKCLWFLFHEEPENKMLPSEFIVHVLKDECKEITTDKRISALELYNKLSGEVSSKEE